MEVKLPACEIAADKLGPERVQVGFVARRDLQAAGLDFKKTLRGKPIS